MKDLSKYNFHYLLLLAFTGTFFSACNEKASLKIKTEKGAALGTTYTIKYESDRDAKDIKAGIASIFNHINKAMSTYLPDSDISRINRGDTTIVINKHFKAVFLKAKEVWQNSNGKFDPTVGALVNIWGFGPEKGPGNVSQQQLDSILNFTGFDKIFLSKNGKIVKTHTNVYLDFNALAKGYTIDCIGRLFREKGIENYLIELGGEILAGGYNTRTDKSWKLAIDSPLQQENERILMARLQLTDQAIATSGNYRKFRTDSVTGIRYAHIIDPKTGYPQKTNVLSVSVIADTCMEADAYATALMLMQPEETKALLQQLNTIEAYIVYDAGDNDLTTYATEGFEKLMLN